MGLPSAVEGTREVEEVLAAGWKKRGGKEKGIECAGLKLDLWPTRTGFVGDRLDDVEG
jgi:hypothetical protein